MRKLQKEKERAAEDSDTREPMPTRVVRGGGESGGEGGGEGGGGLSVPSEHLALLVEQTEWLSGSRAPRQPLARRAYLDEAWRRTLSLPGS